MSSTTQRFAVLTIAAAIAITSFAMLLRRHVSGARPAKPVVEASMPATADAATNLVAAIRSSAPPVTDLKVTVVDGIAIIRGTVDTLSDAEAVGAIVRNTGYARVANLLQQRKSVDDGMLVRDTERQLATSPLLDGCRFGVASERGVVTVRGTIRSEMQRDTVAQIVRRVNGVQGVKLDLQRAGS